MLHFNAPNLISAGAAPQTLLEELTALHRPPSWISSVSFQTEGGKGKKGEGEGGINLLNGCLKNLAALQTQQ